MWKKLLVIINPVSGTPAPIVSILSSVLDPIGCEWDVVVTHRAHDAEQAARRALKKNYDAVAVYGGDGTVMEVAQVLITTPLPLVILPGGTANVVAKDLGVPQDIHRAVQIFERPLITKKIDTGVCNGIPFLIRVNVGVLADIVIKTNRERKNNLGSLGYAVSMIESMTQQPAKSTYSLTLGTESTSISVVGVGVMITNIGNIGIPGISLVPTISSTDGLLDIFVLQDTDLQTVLSVSSTALNTPLWPEHIQHWQATTATLKIQPVQSIVHDDAALPTSSELNISVNPSSLVVAV